MGNKIESPVDYWLTEHGLLLLKCWARDGYSQQEIADKVEISRAMLYKWRQKYPEIDNAISVGKEIVDYRVENALLKSALGYKVKETKAVFEVNKFSGKISQVRKEVSEKEIPPNMTAAMSWLNNRKPEQWKRNRDNSIDIQDDDRNIIINVKTAKNNDDNEDDDWNTTVNEITTGKKKAVKNIITKEEDR